MVTGVELAGAFSSLNSAVKFLQTLNSIKTAAELNEVKVRLQADILQGQQGLFEAQQAQASALSRIADLEQQIMDMKKWNADKQNYELVEILPAGFAYMEKIEMGSGQPAHWLCANCFEQSQKSILQLKKEARPWATYHCNRCSAEMTVFSRSRPQHPDPQ